MEQDYDDGLLEVEIWHEGREKDVYFNGQNAWVYTEWDIRRAELPQAVSILRVSSVASAAEINFFMFFLLFCDNIVKPP